jgi:YYY domain-containing protein
MWPLFQWWLVLEGLGFLMLPLSSMLFSRASAYGYPFAKVLALLVLTYVSWLAGFVAPMSMALHASVVLLAVASIAVAWKQRPVLVDWLANGGWRQIATHDLLWTAGFLFFAWQRSLSPDINGAEKFMDFAFFNVLVRTDAMPPADPWMSGETINYYYFGYLMFANLARLVSLPTYISYNLCVVTAGGLAFALTSAVVLQITRRLPLAVLGGAMSAVLGNLDGFLQFVEKGTVRGMDYWRSSRVVARGDTINEFPYFSTIHGDLHPHFMVLPVSIVLLGILLDEKLFPSRSDAQPRDTWSSWGPYALVAFVFGSVFAISTWELPVGAIAIFLLAGRSQSLRPFFSPARLLLVARTGLIVVFGYVLFLPFYQSFSAPTAPPGPEDVCIGSACFQLAQTSLGQFLTVFGLLLFPPIVLVAVRSWPLLPVGRDWRHLFAALIGFTIVFAALMGNAVLPLLAALAAGALLVAYGGAAEEERGGYLLVVAGSAALLACELVFIKDSYGAKLYRMNTVFKFYFQAWTIFAIAAPWCLGRLIAHEWQWRPMPRVILAAVALLVGAAACYPLGITADRSGNVHATIDGNDYLRRYHAGDYAAIEWLRDNVPDLEVILEATGNPYDYYARFSSNTGLPTVMGWGNHEGLWRGHNSEVGNRIRDVKRIYDAPTLAEVTPLLDRYDVRYILVGELERRDHQPAGLAKFDGLEAAFRSGQTVIYKR